MLNNGCVSMLKMNLIPSCLSRGNIFFSRQCSRKIVRTVGVIVLVKSTWVCLRTKMFFRAIYRWFLLSQKQCAFLFKTLRRYNFGHFAETQLKKTRIRLEMEFTCIVFLFFCCCCCFFSYKKPKISFREIKRTSKA